MLMPSSLSSSDELAPVGQVPAGVHLSALLLASGACGE